MIDNQLIEKVKQYRYLGVMFNASGSFSDAKEELYKRGLKALFKMYKCFEGHKPDTLSRLFCSPSAVSERRTMSSAYNKQFNFRELRVTGLQVWSKISGRSLINNSIYIWSIQKTVPSYFYD
jgi:hypothetical protein